MTALELVLKKQEIKDAALDLQIMLDSMTESEKEAYQAEDVLTKARSMLLDDYIDFINHILNKTEV